MLQNTSLIVLSYKKAEAATGGSEAITGHVL